ncbi:MAG: RidA family protein [Bacteroidetes bacterium]|nr:RidA family protein [Bacteroidota bacterium]MCL5738316.1 RidA family protein [Bacteroidota bacterium]
MTTSKNGQVQHINPDVLSKNPAFTNVISVTGNVKMVYIGGQDAVDASGTIVGKGNIKQQTEQVFSNLQAALKAGGAELEHVIKWNIYIVQGQPIQPAFEVFQSVWGRRPNPPAISVMFVFGLANPDFLVEMDAIAVVPEKQQSKITG